MAPKRAKRSSSLVGNSTTPLVEKALRGELDDLTGDQMFSTNHCRAKLAAERVAEGLPVVKHRNGKIDLGIFLEDTVKSEFVCHYCNHSFSYKSVLERHVKRIHEKHLMPNFKCPRCDYNTVWKDQLRSHFSVVHQNIKPFSCSKCPFRAPKSCRVVSHINKCHGGIGQSIRTATEANQGTTSSAIPALGKPRDPNVQKPHTSDPLEATAKADVILVSDSNVEKRSESSVKASNPCEESFDSVPMTFEEDELSGFDLDE